MKAVVLSHYGAPTAVLRLEERPIPQPGPGEVRVKVHATAINDWDLSWVRGKPRVYRLLFGISRPKVSVLGTEIAGTVDAVGADVQSFVPGARVYGDLSEAGFGGFAEYVCVKEDALAPMAETMRFEDAAALPHAAMLAMQGLIDVGRIREGEKVLINGAGGGVGVLAFQLAKRYRAEVTGVDARAKLPMMRELGFDHVLDYETVDFTQTGQRYDLVLDVKTSRSPSAYLRALAPRGRYVTVGGEPAKLLSLLIAAPLARATSKRLSIVALKPNKDLAYINELFTARALKTVIDGPYSLRQVPEALERFGAAKHVGKIVVQVAEA